MRPFFVRLAIVAAALGAGLGASPALAQSFSISPATRAIEEEWELVIADPDPDGDGPQIQTYMSPVPNDSEPYFWLMLNARDRPYEGGGIQVQAWTHAEDLLGSARWGSAKLNTNNETITWRQRITYISSGGSQSFRYEIRQGNSNTWGSFGHTNGLSAVSYPTNLIDLSGYRPAASLQYTRVGWQPNRVTSLTLRRIRQYNNDGGLINTFEANYAVNLSPSS